MPVLWDKKRHTIVNNESSEIIRIFNSAFNDTISKEKAELDFYPQHLRKEIDEVNEWVYDSINSVSSFCRLLPQCEVLRPDVWPQMVYTSQALRRLLTRTGRLLFRCSSLSIA